MPRFGPIKRRELVASLRLLGFEGPFPGKKHEFMERGDITVSIPNPHRGDIRVTLLSRVLRQAAVTREEWEAR